MGSKTYVELRAWGHHRGSRLSMVAVLRLLLQKWANSDPERLSWGTAGQGISLPQCRHYPPLRDPLRVHLSTFGSICLPLNSKRAEDLTYFFVFFFFNSVSNRTGSLASACSRRGGTVTVSTNNEDSFLTVKKAQ